MPTHTTIGKFEPETEQPAEPKYETLADVPEFVAVRRLLEGGAASIFAMWRTDSDKIVSVRMDASPCVSPSPVLSPSEVRVHSVLGRITAIQFTKEQP